MAFYFAFFNVSNANQELRERRARSQREKERRRHSEASVANNLSVGDELRASPRPRVVSSHSIRPPTPPTRRSTSPDDEEFGCGSTSATCAFAKPRSPEFRNKKVTFEQLSASREQLLIQKRKLSEGGFLDNRQVWNIRKHFHEKRDSNPWMYSIGLPAPASTPDVEYLEKTEYFRKQKSPLLSDFNLNHPTTSQSIRTTSRYVHSKRTRGDSPVWVPRTDLDYRRESAPSTAYGLGSSVTSSSKNPISVHVNTWPPTARKSWKNRLLRRRSTTDRSRSPQSNVRYRQISELSSRPNFLPINSGNRRFKPNLHAIRTSVTRRMTNPEVVPLIRREHVDVTEAECAEYFEFSEMKKLVESNIF